LPSDNVNASRVAREDVLRFIHERGGRASLQEIGGELGSSEAAARAVGELERMGLVSIEDDMVSLTEKGRGEALEVYRRHVEAERLLERLLPRDQVHRAAHYMERMPQLSRELVEYIVSRGRAVRLTELERGAEARVLAVLDPRPEIVARLYGVGLLPGRRVRLLARGPHVYLLEVGSEGRVAAVDDSVASQVIVVPEG